jgi:hypothetical protein
MKQLTVGDLIVLFKNYDPSLKVEVEGCDCYCRAVDIRVDHVHLAPSLQHVNGTEERDCTNVEHHYLLIMSDR